MICFFIMQEFIVIVLFTIAAVYLGWRGYKSVIQQDAGCGKGCGCETDKATAKAISAKR